MNTTNFNINSPEDLYYKLSPINVSGLAPQNLSLPSISKSIPIHKSNQNETQNNINLVNLYNESLKKLNNDSNNAKVNSDVKDINNNNVIVNDNSPSINNNPNPVELSRKRPRPKQDTLSALINNCYQNFNFESNPTYLLKDMLYDKAVELLGFKNKIEQKDETKIKDVFSSSISRLKYQKKYNKNLKEINLVKLKDYFFRDIPEVNNYSVANDNIIINNNNAVVINNDNHISMNDLVISLINNCYDNFSFELHENSKISNSIYGKSVELLKYKNKIDQVYEKQIKSKFGYAIRQLKYRKNYNKDLKEINLIKLKELFFKDIPILNEQINTQTNINLESKNNIPLSEQQNTIAKVTKALMHVFNKAINFPCNSSRRPTWKDYFLFALKLLNEKKENISSASERKVIGRMESAIIMGRVDEFDKVDPEALRKHLFAGITFKTQTPSESKNEANIGLTNQF
jgi:hypothetical protein